MGRGRWRPKRWVVLLCGGLGAFIALVLVVALYTGIGPYDLPPKSRQLDDVLAESEKLGLPMTQAELVSAPPPAENNAAPEVVTLMAQMRQRTPQPALMFAPDGSQEKSQAFATVRDHDDVLYRITQLLDAKPEWQVERDYDLGVFLLFPEYADTKDAVRMFYWRAALHARARDLAATIQDFRTARLLGGKWADEPTIIALLVSIACDQIALRSIEIAGAEFAHDSRALLELERTVLSTNQRLDPTQAFRGEFYVGLTTLRNFKQFGGLDVFKQIDVLGTDAPEVDPSKLQRSGPPKGMFQRASMTVIGSFWNEVFETFQTIEVPRRGWGHVLDSQVEVLESRLRLSEILPRILLPVYGKAEQALYNHDVTMDLTVALLRCLRFKAENRRWPETLKEADAEFPDPLSGGQPIRAKFASNELRVWSVGRNGVDDGGVFRRDGRTGEDTVVVWPPELRYSDR